ncbi:trypsin-like peptidase domain-containing protein [Candidatus Uhrbacteria bacterium]|nr:trypsin-like peptidase domain-containing protein [Candidatus Uhrbacteria bacterium]
MSRLRLSACFLLFFGCAAGGANLTSRERNQHATFLLTNPVRGQCSGVVLTNDGYILTAAHCVRNNAEYLDVHVRDAQIVRARVMAYNQERDLALLKADHSFDSAAALHAGRTLQAGDTIYHVGYPFSGRRGLPQLLGVGHIMNPDAELLQHVGTRWILIDLETGRPGASGSGAYDAETGGLIGMVDAVLTITAPGFDSMSVVLLVPVNYIREFLRENGVTARDVNDISDWNLESAPPQVQFTCAREPQNQTEK